MGYTLRATQEDPENAMTWAVSINGRLMRSRIMERVAGTWQAEDPAAFETFLETTNLTDKEKKRLQNTKTPQTSPIGGRLPEPSGSGT